MDALSIRPCFDSGSISESEIYTFLDHLESALRFIIDRPESLLRDVELINDREMRLLLPEETEREFKGSGQPWARAPALDSIQNVSELIELQVQRTPQKIAVSSFIRE